MALTNAFFDAVNNGNVRRIRIMMKDSLPVDPTFKELKEMETAAAKVSGLYDVHGDRLTPDEEDEYEYLANKFKRPAYDLSKFYTCTYPNNVEEIALLSQKCGIYGLQQTLQGENV